MSSVLYQSFNSNGSPALRGDINTLRNQLNDVKKDLALLLKVLNEKSPEVADEFAKLKDQEAALNAASALPPPPPPSRNAVNTLRR
jgi:predicted  nucleic acid-binding Zn-ribbon protein